MWCGIFVGGASSRMGGVPKGLLYHPESRLPLAEHLVGEARRAGLEPALVGEASAYAELVPEVERIPDAALGIGPIGGLLALLRAARTEQAIALACDMPWVRAEHLARLVAAPPAPVAAARKGGRWEPFLARYDAPAVLPLAWEAVAAGRLSLQALLDAAGATVVELPDEALVDWDTPDDRG